LQKNCGICCGAQTEATAGSLELDRAVPHTSLA
jgi:hypothetical protein